MEMIIDYIIRIKRKIWKVMLGSQIETKVIDDVFNFLLFLDKFLVCKYCMYNCV